MRGAYGGSVAKKEHRMVAMFAVPALHVERRYHQ